MKISLRRALELAVGPANVDAAGHAVADWFDGRNWPVAADLIREQLQDQQGGDAVPHNRPDTSLRAELMAKLATQREVILSLCDRVERLEMRADGLTPIERVERRWAKEAAGGDKLDRLIAQDKEAGGPAVPDGREPAALVGEPSDEELLGLMHQSWRDDLAKVSRLADLEAGTAAGVLRVTHNHDVVRFARAVLARWGHQPAPPAEGEVGELEPALPLPTGKESTRLRNCPTHGQQPPWAWGCPECVRQLREELAALHQRHAEPVPVSERLPGPEDCDENGYCWLIGPRFPTWDLSYPPKTTSSTMWTHWLPATALPLPAGEVQE